jgi:hypothetical protein
VRWEEYETGLEDRLVDLHSRVHRGAYRAKPSRRVFIPKADGRQRGHPTETGELGTRCGQAPKKTKKPKGIKRVFKVTMADEGATPFAFAGIWDSWNRPDGTGLETFALVTTEPNELVSQIHERLALILHPKDYHRWLGIDDRGDPRPPLDLVHPFDSDQMKMRPADPAVGNVNNNGPDMLTELDDLRGR